MIKQNVIQNPLRTETSSFFGYQQHYLRKQKLRNPHLNPPLSSHQCLTLSPRLKNHLQGEIASMRSANITVRKKKTQQCQTSTHMLHVWYIYLHLSHLWGKWW